MGAGKVWIDILTPKQVLFFAPIIDELEKRGLRILGTTREYREVGPIAKWAGLELVSVGKRGGADIVQQLEASSQRQKEIIPIVSEFAPNAAVSIASGVCARVAFGLKVKHIAVNDSPHSEVANRLSLPLTYRLMCPWIIPYSAWSRYGLARSQITRYRALDPAAWLKRPPTGGYVPKLDPGKKTITIRVEEAFAPYMVGTDRGWTDTVLTHLAEAFRDCNLVALCRYGEQLAAVKAKFGSKFIVPDEVVDGRRLLENTDLFIGMGGTMTAEAALLGVPTISMFQGSLVTEDYLKSVGLLVKARNPEAILGPAKRFLTEGFRAAYSMRAKKVLGSMEDPVPKIAAFIASTAGQA